MSFFSELLEFSFQIIESSVYDFRIQKSTTRNLWQTSYMRKYERERGNLFFHFRKLESFD